MEQTNRVVAVKEVEGTAELYVLIDFLNRNLKDKDVIFGLSKSNQPGKYTVTIYRTDV
ncbi:YpmA family protein [Sulfoacidibacillus thermotolerans]|uniref:YpmA family protein n=1 Tax=Sulfoacidibacillus thermotolerans TaxID=1765684 RepID=UPI000D6891DA|nr:YpmA family protein [Sulfoacidibacillus thermotolerans]